MDYTLIRSRRKTLAVQITRDGKVTVRAPFKIPQAKIDAFLAEKAAWIEKHIIKIVSVARLPKYDDAKIRGFIIALKKILPEKVSRFAAEIGVDYGKITVRRQRTIWGSCTANGNLSFNCLLACVPPEISDYVIIHELVHRKYMNHSAAFWAAVERYCPDYKARRAWLKARGAEYLNRL